MVNKTYQGAACKRGHSGIRYLCSGGCVDCRKEKGRSEKRTPAELERMKVASRAWYLRNKKQRADKQKEKRAANIPAYKDGQRRSYQKHKEKRLATGRKYYSTHKAEAFAKSHIRRARKAGAGGTHTVEDIKNIFAKQRGRCAGCRRKLKKKHTDHIVPLVLGGDNSALNIQLLCPACNLQKHAKHPVEFMQEKGFLL